ncbi:protein kinase [Rhodococcus sp. NPDC127530]|uniref:protein kinase domain-containing protein n=1 Tax=unclassified Rhodococcus (in: high G+C Gram-positive bacteria) TaxID=192944 RepID=UPI0036446072
MDRDDPLDTQRSGLLSVAAELEAAGFEKAQQIGRGGFGVVYRCTQPDLDRTVAVKVLGTELDEENRERFYREQRAMGQLTEHPNVGTVLQVGTTSSGLPYIVMPYYPQGTLDMRIRRQGRLPLDELLRLGVKTAGAVEAAHQLGILHRDIKPANILFTEYDEPVLTDFGIAHISGGYETAAGTIIGSPAYTAPEGLSGHAPTPASDIYGLGATLFSALTGHAAFERRSGEQIVAQFVRITTDPVPDLREHGIPADVSAIVEQAMAARPQDRPPTAAALGDQLRGAQLGHGFPVDQMALHRKSGATRVPVLRVSGGSGHTLLGQRPSPLHVIPGSKGNLPVELTSFVGRRAELGDAKTLLTASHLVTLTGFGGVGKTRLALRVADSLKRAFADGVWLVELGELSDGSMVVNVAAAALGLRDQPARPLFDVLLEFLAARQLLLVLDNCEQLVGAAAEFVETLLRGCPRLRVLATSREPLGVGGESVLRVPPLTAPDPDRQPSVQAMPRYDAVTLFVERAATAVPTFALTDRNKNAVTRICHRLDGLPLPIELAAARLPVLSPEQILQRLTDRYTLLTRGTRRAPSRQQTLRLCIDWSHELCTEQEQLVWSRLSVFAGSVDLAAAEPVCGGGLAPEELLDAVASLVDKSILNREESGSAVRFRMLDTLRDYGRERLQQGGEDLLVRRKHRDYYRQLVLDAEAEWISSRQLDWLARLEREQPNLREALEFCVSDGAAIGLEIAAALYPYWSARGLFSEGRHWLDRLLACQTAPSTAEQVKALYAGSALAEIQGDLEAETALVARARALATTHDSNAQALIARADGFLALTKGDFPRATASLERALHLIGTQEDFQAISATVLLGMAYDQLGDTKRAIDCFERVLAVTEARGETIYRSYALRAAAVAMWRQGERSGAAPLLEQALRLAHRVGDPRTAASCLELLAWIADSKQGARRAVVLMAAAQELALSIGSFTVWFPDMRVHHEECMHSTRRVLGDRRFDEAWCEGQALDLNAAVAYALNEPLAAKSASPQSITQPALTKRELQVAELVATGLTNRAIAERLVISPRTAQGHVEHVLAKLGFTSRAQVAAWIADRDSPG